MREQRGEIGTSINRQRQVRQKDRQRPRVVAFFMPNVFGPLLYMEDSSSHCIRVFVLPPNQGRVEGWWGGVTAAALHPPASEPCLALLEVCSFLASRAVVLSSPHLG